MVTNICIIINNSEETVQDCLLNLTLFFFSKDSKSGVIWPLFEVNIIVCVIGYELSF